MANKIISEQWTFDLHHRLLEGIRAKLDKIEVRHSSGEIKCGTQAIEVLIQNNWEHLQLKQTAMKELNFIILEINYFLGVVGQKKYLNKELMRFEIDMFVGFQVLPLLKKLEERIKKEKEEEANGALIGTISALRETLRREHKSVFTTKE